MDTKLLRSFALTIMVLALIGMPFLGNPIPTSASPPKNVAATTPPPSSLAPDSVPVETGLGANIMLSENWRGFLKVWIRLTNKTPSSRTFRECIGANGKESCKNATAPANSETTEVHWDYYSSFGLTPGTTYNMWYTSTVSGFPPVLGQRLLTTDELPQIGVDVLTRACTVNALAAVDIRPRDDPTITVTLSGGAVIWTGHLAQDQWSGWIDVASATGGPVAVIIDATWPGRSPSRDVVYVTTCAPPPCIELGDYVWVDGNANGQQDQGEAGLSGVTVTATGANGSVTTTTTSGSGYYLFPCLYAGTYTVSFQIPPEFVFTSPNVGSDLTDSDPINGIVQVVLTEDNLTIDAGVIRTSTASVICLCVELLNGHNVVRWSLGSTANGSYAIFRGNTPDRTQATMVTSWMPGVGTGTHEWVDPQVPQAIQYYWLAELSNGNVTMYGPVNALSVLCQIFIPLVRQ